MRILNPLSADLNVMRQTLLFNMLEAVALNANRRNGDLCLYEFGNCYFYDEAKRSEENRLAAYSEEYRLAIAVTGVSTSQSWNAKPEKASFFTLRAVAEKLLRRFGIDIYALKTESLESDLFSEGLSMSLNGKELLQIGSVAAKIRRLTDVKQEVYYLEMNFDALVKSTKKQKIAAEELSKFPEVKRDLALLVDKQVTFAALRDAAFAAERKLLKSVSLFDVYEGDKLPGGQEILCPELHPRRQDPHARRQDHRARDVESHPPVRTALRRSGSGLTRTEQSNGRLTRNESGGF